MIFNIKKKSFVINKSWKMVADFTRRFFHNLIWNEILSYKTTIFEIWDHRTFFVDFYQLLGPTQLSEILNEIGFESTARDDSIQIWKKRENISWKNCWSTYPSSIYSWFLKPLSLLHSRFPTKKSWVVAYFFNFFQLFQKKK